VLQLKSPYKDGTTHIVMEPLEFMERLAALVPRPRLHLIRFHGVLAPNAKLRSKIVPAPAERATEPPTDHAQGQGETPRMSWARLLKRVFDIDIERRKGVRSCILLSVTHRVTCAKSWLVLSE
jgi:Putative transposase